MSISEIGYIESSLNNIKFAEVGLGGLMSSYNDQIFRNAFKYNYVGLTKLILRHLWFALNPFRKAQDFSVSAVYFKSGNHRHLDKLEKAVTNIDFLKDNCLVIGQSECYSINKVKVLGLVRIIDIFRAIIFLNKNSSIINAIILDNKEFEKLKDKYYLLLFIQLLKCSAFNLFLNNQKKIKILAGDYDRGVDSSVLFSVAKKYGVKCFSLQHGVINPPVGYSPINANEIWVWGEMAKKQLLSLGVKEENIRIVGTPILDLIERSSIRRRLIAEKYILGHGRNVVLALSTPDKVNDRILVHFYNNIKLKFAKTDDNFWVKIHPARNVADFKWIESEFGLKILPNTIEYSEFINITDVVFAHSSGIITEAIYYGIKVGILDILKISPGNGLEVHKFFGIPLIRETSDAEKVFSYDDFNITNFAFQSIGDESAQNIKRNIYEIYYS